MYLFFIFLISITLLKVLIASDIPGSDIQTPSNYNFIKEGPYGSKLYSIIASDSVYIDSPYLLDLTAETSYQQGYDNAYLIGDKYIDNYNSLMVALLGDEWWEPAVANLVNIFVDWQWNDYLSAQLPQEYLDELRGMTDGGYAADLKEDIAVYAGRGITLANLPGTLSNLKYVLQDEKEHPAHHEKSLPLTPEQIVLVIDKLEKNWLGLTCSMFGVWGSRTLDGKLYTGRNLDWLKDSGLSKNKLVTIHHPPSGFVHATFGWAGIWGAITGISSQGLTVHEANLESDDTTFRGFPWVLRLRHVMAHAQNIAEGLNIWSETNNTVGFNHGIGSAVDGEAVCLETMKGNTAVFYSNDEREQDSVTGEPRTEAVFRTNHGYDSYTDQHYIDGAGSYNNSLTRYNLFPEMFDNYQEQGVAITYIEAINVTAVVGNKGMEENQIYRCTSSSGINILSVTYDPKELIAYAAWENGSGDSWTPAACNTYLTLDLNHWLVAVTPQ